jgi:uncharacterized protein YecT (DUF1311 family)
MCWAWAGLAARSMTLMRLGTAAAVVLATLAAAACGQAAAPSPPVIHEPFTPLPCPKHAVTTVGMEGCVEESILRSDKRINALVRTIFSSLPVSNRAIFAQSERSWLRYRQGSCDTAASGYAGGSIQPVFFGECLASRNATHLKDLAQLRCDVLPQDKWPPSCTAKGR